MFETNELLSLLIFHLLFIHEHDERIGSAVHSWLERQFLVSVRTSTYSRRFLVGEVTVIVGLLGLDGPLECWAPLFICVIQYSVIYILNTPPLDS
jgi:hypothetical protein